jgi:hypothetical protein
MRFNVAKQQVTSDLRLFFAQALRSFWALRQAQGPKDLKTCDIKKEACASFFYLRFNLNDKIQGVRY